MDPSTEIRKLAPSHVRNLVDILEYAEAWKKLMCKIPKTLEKTHYECKLERNNLPKYHSEHFRMIENASNKFQKSCTEILLDEWGTSGRIRPAVGHLLFLLTEAELFRAVDYVAKHLLQIDPPKRPAVGPAAPVNLTPTESNPYKEQLELLLNNISYPSSELNPERTAEIDDINLNINRNTADNGYYDKKNIDVDLTSNSNNNGTNIENISEVSDMMKFSRSADLQSENLQNLPALTELNLQLQSESVTTSGVDNNIPQISVLLQNDSFQEGDTISDVGSDSFSTSNISANNTQSEIDNEGNTPNLSDLMRSNISSNNYTNNIDDSNSNFIPIVIDSFVRSNESSSDTTNTAVSETKSNDTSKTVGVNISSRPCASPLPNLSLNTLLPHFTYAELDTTTNNFDETPHKNSLEMANSLDEKNGRFLGSGAFGSVFLSLGLLDKPVAVKKMHLKDMQEVQLTDTITKQFRNEVEILSRYNHENLLKLIGYSCDGPTYCLLYEYLSGGNLQGRLAKTKEKLNWQQRIKIAQGTAKSISYLHTAFATPLIHRDIKTANILLDCSNNPKLGDFGIIKLSPNTNTAISTTIIGTSVYMAPEALRSGDVSVKTDAFSFGVVLLELLTALPPFDADRRERDLISYVEEECEQDSNTTITPLLDIKAGTWMENGIDFAHNLYKISLKCFEEKKKRPTMVDVTVSLDSLVEDLIKEEFV